GPVRSLHPQAKRVLLVQVLDVVSGEALHRAMTLGQADAWLTRPWAHHDEALYAQVGDLLDEWRQDSGRQQFVTVHMVGEWGAPGSWAATCSTGTPSRTASSRRTRSKAGNSSASPAAGRTGSQCWSCLPACHWT